MTDRFLDPLEPATTWETAHRPTWAEIDLDAVTANARALGALAAPAGVMAVVKADAYGHGAVWCARAALEGGARWLGVAALEEGVELRQAGIQAPILILSASTPGQADTIARHDLVAAVFEPVLAEALAAAGRRLGRPVHAHLKVDTGMGRIGVTPDEAGAALAVRLAESDGLVLDGAYTHFATSDEADKTFAHHQKEAFDRFLALASRAGLRFRWRHAANSAAVTDLPGTSYDLVRVGISLYGYYASADVERARVSLRPAMTWRSRLVNVKRVPGGTPISYGREHVTTGSALVGTIPVGYADGYRRSLKNGRGQIWLKGRRCPVLGRVNMDHIMVGLDSVPEAAIGDAVIIMGGSPPSRGKTHAAPAPGPNPDALGPDANEDRPVSAEELADAAQTIVYEIVSTVGRRVPRVYLRGGRPVAARSILGETLEVSST